MNTSKKNEPKPFFNESKTSLIDGNIAKDEEWLTTEDVMKHLNLSKSSVYRLRVKKLIPAYKLGGTVVYPKSLINKMLLNKALKNLNSGS
ncbi:hypothetical protein BWZ22_15330 [Seonamhaeicola sp. S2-3]|uniref:helix-turn-helix domain-containing protein n=1 Tax=Seonamhaeicola sp. S2-3 TaxID=1936081 RepID=UPI000972E214|nr:helix-turn-helix domain-containing protein [Seonamhaeicola sp. S2-3]APY12505.1 hypothetical protein BWZ22_15330 [Seonamhaeicola sp. S2-3]